MIHTATPRMAASATLHCLVGCAVGEMVGVTIGTHTGIGISDTLVLASGLSFVSGYAFSTVPILRSGQKLRAALRLVLVADTVSILTMTITDNICMLLIPGAFEKDLAHPIYWVSRIISLSAAFIVAWPVNYYLLSKGRGHALTHQYMHGSHEEHH